MSLRKKYEKCPLDLSIWRVLGDSSFKGLKRLLGRGGQTVRPQPKSTYGSCLVQGKILPVGPQSPRPLVPLRSAPVPSLSSFLTLSSYSLQPLASFLILRHAQPGMFSPPKSHDPDVFRSLLQCHFQKPSPTLSPP